MLRFCRIRRHRLRSPLAATGEIRYCLDSIHQIRRRQFQPTPGELQVLARTGWVADGVPKKRCIPGDRQYWNEEKDRTLASQHRKAARCRAAPVRVQGL